jgi:hypothetical protein
LKCAASASKELQSVQIELATQRERATAAEQRATDLVSQLKHQQGQNEREIAQLRESQAATAAALRQIEARSVLDQKSNGVRSKRSAKGTDR